ncbi:MAG TPA: PIN domain-containing protein [Pyrinomonadaceae bacterium]|nr:PIN domain-containing protein [Pyrinomonadaceae bacterium]
MQRPIDDQSQARIEQETEAVIIILSFCEAGTLMLVSSEVLQIEIGENLDLERKEMVLETLQVAEEIVLVNPIIEKRAQELEKYGIKAFDALHLASAEAGKADYFCTCDDKLLKKTKILDDLQVKAVSPIELLEEIWK